MAVVNRTLLCTQIPRESESPCVITTICRSVLTTSVRVRTYVQTYLLTAAQLDSLLSLVVLLLTPVHYDTPRLISVHLRDGLTPRIQLLLFV